MTKHTPGPWQRHQINGRFSGQIVGVDGLVSVCNTFERMTQPEPQDKWLEEHHANARLIAAAPELLAAAETLLLLWEAQAITGAAPDAEAWGKINRECDKARAAIAKAEGQS